MSTRRFFANLRDSACRGSVPIATYATLGVIVIAMLVGFVARTVTVQRQMSDITSQIASLEVSLLEARAQAQAASVATNTAQSNLMQVIPGVCKLECRNGGAPNSNCSGCDCAGGFGGKWCHIPERCLEKCPSDTRACYCRHGAFLDDSCYCSCPPGWTGDRCLTVDDKANINDRINFLVGLFNRSVEAYEHSEKENRKRAALGEAMLPHHLGLGYDKLNRDVKVPVLQMRPGSGRVVSPHSGASYIVPHLSNYAAPSDTTPRVIAENFNSMNDYVAWLVGLYKNGVARPGVLAKSIATMGELFGTYQESFIATTQVTVPQFTLSLVSNNHLEDYALDDTTAAAIDYLPKTYNSNEDRQLYDTFLNYWGDSFIVEVGEGGMIETVHGVHKSVCNNIPNTASRTNYLTESQKDFAVKFFAMRGLPFAGAQFDASSTYSSSAAADSAACSGGDPVRCAQILENKLDLGPWTTTLFDLPAPVSLVVRPIADLIRDPEKKAALMQAIEKRNSATISGFYNSLGREVDVCPKTYPMPSNWLSSFGDLKCFEENAKCWSQKGAFFDVCKKVKVVSTTNRSPCHPPPPSPFRGIFRGREQQPQCIEILRCQSPDGSNVDFQWQCDTSRFAFINKNRCSWKALCNVNDKLPWMRLFRGIAARCG